MLMCISVEGMLILCCQEMTKRYPGVPVLMTGIGTVLASHLGPGCIGLFVRIKA